MPGCSREECPGSGIWVPVFVLRRKRGDDKPMRARLKEIAQCELHKERGSLADFLSDEGWDRMEKHLREAGKGRFMKNLTSLEWETAPGMESECLPF